MDHITATSSNSRNGSDKRFACDFPGCQKGDQAVDKFADHPLKMVSKQTWKATIERLKQGRKWKGVSFPPAIITTEGCQLPQWKTNEAGYINIRPIAGFTSKGRNDEPGKPQLAHRVVCYLTKCDEDVHNMLYRGYHVSHLCHRPGCINADHLVVETEEYNQSRKICSVKVNVKTLVNGREYFVKAEECPHFPACIIKIELRAARIIDSR